MVWALLYADNIVLMEELRKDLQCVKTEGVYCVLVMRLRLGCIGHFVLECIEFMWRRRQLIKKIGKMEGAERWV